MSRWGARAHAAKRAADAMTPRPQHLSAEARAVPGAFPARYSQVVNVACPCGRVIVPGEYVLRGGRHAACQAVIDRLGSVPALAALRAEDERLAGRLAYERACFILTGRSPFLFTRDEGAVLDRLAPGWQTWLRREPAGDRPWLRRPVRA